MPCSNAREHALRIGMPATPGSLPPPHPLHQAAGTHTRAPSPLPPARPPPQVTDIGVLVLDEVHHALAGDPFAVLMRDFVLARGAAGAHGSGTTAHGSGTAAAEEGEGEALARPRVLGLTASPLQPLVLQVSGVGWGAGRRLPPRSPLAWGGRGAGRGCCSGRHGGSSRFAVCWRGEGPATCAAGLAALLGGGMWLNACPRLRPPPLPAGVASCCGRPTWAAPGWWPP